MQEVDWTRPTAFVLGNERQGVSDTAVQLADATAIIPMAGEWRSMDRIRVDRRNQPNLCCSGTPEHRHTILNSQVPILLSL